MSDRSKDGGPGRALAMVLLGMVLGVVVAELARRVLVPPRPALAPGHPAGPDDGLVAEEALGDSVPGNGSAEAPPGFPVKGNERSGIYHLPGGFAYDRTIASVFFRTPEAAQRAGFRAAKA